MPLTPGLNFTSPPPKGELSQRALERRLKRHFLKKVHVFSASCEPGLTSVLSKEVRTKLEPDDMEIFQGGVEFSGKLELGLLANLELRTAQRINLRVCSFICKSYPELYNKMLRIPWELFLGIDPVIEIKVSSKQSKLHQTDNIADTVYSGIRDYYERFKGEVGREKGKFKLYVRFFMDRVILSFDLSGDHLHLRGRKNFTVDAPMRETLAAGVLLWNGLEEYPVVVDPCCGSGTMKEEYNWTEVQNLGEYQYGDMVFWGRPGESRLRHVGLIVEQDVYGKWWTVDNSSSQLRVMKRPLSRGANTPVKKAIRYHE